MRYNAGTTPTDYTYTGQYSDSYINLLWYGSRHYDPYLGRFTSPDSIIPIQQGVQALDRYAYTNNNPVRYTDPTGHPIGCYDDRYDDGPQCAAEGSPSKWYYDNWKYQETAVEDLVEDTISRPIVGFHTGTTGTIDLFYGQYTYSQTDYVLDLKTGTIFKMQTTGFGHYFGAPNGFAYEGYVGTTSVHGIPLSASPDEVGSYLAGANFDIAGDLGFDLLPDVETSVGKGVSIDLDENGMPISTTAGLMHAKETKLGLGGSIIPYPLDIGVQGGTSYTTTEIYYQIPWWPFK